MAQRLVAEKLLIEDLQESTNAIFKKMNAAKDYASYKKLMLRFEREAALFQSNYSRVGFLFYANTLDKKNNELFQYWNSINGKFSAVIETYYKLLKNSVFLKDIKKENNETLYFTIVNKIDFSQKAQELSVAEEQLVAQYQQLSASATYNWNGKQISEGEIMKYGDSLDRSERKKASDLQHSFLAKHDAQITDIFLQLVKTRKEKAKESGYANYPDMMKVEYKRIGYDYADLNKFCDLVKHYFTPLYIKIKEIQRQKLGVEKLSHFDTVFFNKEIKRIGAKSSAALLKNAGQMYAAMDKDMAKLYNHIIAGNHFEYKDKKGKVFAGFANYDFISNEPFIFSLFNGSTFDIKVVTHEFGHAFQMQQTVHKNKDNYNGFPTLDTVEIFSMAMELFTHKDMERFYDRDTPFYVMDNFLEMINTMVACCIWHELQYYIYTTPSLTADKINTRYLKLIKKYFGELRYDDNQYLLAGNGWKRMSHLFFVPFYIIDYTFGALGAFQLKMLFDKNEKETLTAYKQMCIDAKFLNMKNLEKLSPIKSPFKEKTLKKVADYCKNIIEQYDIM